MNIQSILSIISVIVAAIGGLTNLNTSAITPILTKISGIIASITTLKTPDSIEADIADLQTLLTSLQASGAITGEGATAITNALSVLNEAVASIANYKSGQFALIDDNFSAFGVPGVLVAFTKTGPAYQLFTTGTTDPTQQ